MGWFGKIFDNPEQEPILAEEAPVNPVSINIDQIMLQEPQVSVHDNYITMVFKQDSNRLTCKLSVKESVENIHVIVNNAENGIDVDTVLNMTQETELLKIAASSLPEPQNETILSGLRDRISSNMAQLDEGLSL